MLTTPTVCKSEKVWTVRWSRFDWRWSHQRTSKPLGQPGEFFIYLMELGSVIAGSTLGETEKQEKCHPVSSHHQTVKRRLERDARGSWRGMRIDCFRWKGVSVWRCQVNPMIRLVAGSGEPLRPGVRIVPSHSLTHFLLNDDVVRREMRCVVLWWSVRRCLCFVSESNIIISVYSVVFSMEIE